MKAVSQEKYVLEMTDIEKQFPGVKALDHAMLKLRPGTVHVFSVFINRMVAKLSLMVRKHLFPGLKMRWTMV